MAWELDAVLVNVKLLLALPGALGVKVTVKDTDWPAGIVTGSVIPESANSLLLRVAELTVTDAPVAVRLALRPELVPSATVPKLRLFSESDSWGVVVPVPVSAIFRFESEALETMLRVPLAEPELVGANVVVNVTLSFGLSVVGKLKPPIENAEPDRLA